MSGVRETAGAGGDRFFFLHMQKTGGTTLRQRLARYFGEAAIYPNRSHGSGVYELIVSVDHLLERLRRHGDEVRVIAGHFPLCARELIGGEPRTFTILRHPVARTLSYLRHHRANTPADRDKSLERIYEDPFRFHGLAHNHMTKMLSLTPEEMSADMLTRVSFTPERLERAKRNLAGLEVVGVQESFEQLCAELNRRFGWRLGDRPRLENASEPVGVPGSFRRRIVEDNAADVELYEQALRLCEERRLRGAAR